MTDVKNFFFFLAFITNLGANGSKLTTQTKMTDFFVHCGGIKMCIIFHLPMPVSLYSFLVKLKLKGSAAEPFLC